jgi:hypothetical protein
MFVPEEISRHGFRYISVGRNSVVPSQSAIADVNGQRATEANEDVQESLA